MVRVEMKHGTLRIVTPEVDQPSLASPDPIVALPPHGIAAMMDVRGKYTVPADARAALGMTSRAGKLIARPHSLGVITLETPATLVARLRVALAGRGRTPTAVLDDAAGEPTVTAGPATTGRPSTGGGPSAGPEHVVDAAVLVHLLDVEVVDDAGAHRLADLLSHGFSVSEAAIAALRTALAGVAAGDRLPTEAAFAPDVVALTERVLAELTVLGMRRVAPEASQFAAQAALAAIRPRLRFDETFTLALAESLGRPALLARPLPDEHPLRDRFAATGAPLVAGYADLGVTPRRPAAAPSPADRPAPVDAGPGTPEPAGSAAPGSPAADRPDPVAIATAVVTAAGTWRHEHLPLSVLAGEFLRADLAVDTPELDVQSLARFGPIELVDRDGDGIVGYDRIRMMVAALHQLCDAAALHTLPRPPALDQLLTALHTGTSMQDVTDAPPSPTDLAEQLAHDGHDIPAGTTLDASYLLHEYGPDVARWLQSFSPAPAEDEHDGGSADPAPASTAEPDTVAMATAVLAAAQTPRQPDRLTWAMLRDALADAGLGRDLSDAQAWQLLRAALHEHGLPDKPGEELGVQGWDRITVLGVALTALDEADALPARPLTPALTALVTALRAGVASTEYAGEPLAVDDLRDSIGTREPALDWGTRVAAAWLLNDHSALVGRWLALDPQPAAAVPSTVDNAGSELASTPTTARPPIMPAGSGGTAPGADDDRPHDAYNPELKQAVAYAALAAVDEIEDAHVPATALLAALEFDEFDVAGPAALDQILFSTLRDYQMPDLEVIDDVPGYPRLPLLAATLDWHDRVGDLRAIVPGAARIVTDAFFPTAVELAALTDSAEELDRQLATRHGLSDDTRADLVWLLTHRRASAESWLGARIQRPGDRLRPSLATSDPDAATSLAADAVRRRRFVRDRLHDTGTAGTAAVAASPEPGHAPPPAGDDGAAPELVVDQRVLAAVLAAVVRGARQQHLTWQFLQDQFAEADISVPNRAALDSVLTTVFGANAPAQDKHDQRWSYVRTELLAAVLDLCHRAGTLPELLTITALRDLLTGLSIGLTAVAGLAEAPALKPLKVLLNQPEHRVPGPVRDDVAWLLRYKLDAARQWMNDLATTAGVAAAGQPPEHDVVPAAKELRSAGGVDTAAERPTAEQREDVQDQEAGVRPTPRDADGMDDLAVARAALAAAASTKVAHHKAAGWNVIQQRLAAEGIQLGTQDQVRETVRAVLGEHGLPEPEPGVYVSYKVAPLVAAALEAFRHHGSLSEVLADEHGSADTLEALRTGLTAIGDRTKITMPELRQLLADHQVVVGLQQDVAWMLRYRRADVAGWMQALGWNTVAASPTTSTEESS